MGGALNTFNCPYGPFQSPNLHETEGTCLLNIVDWRCASRDLSALFIGRTGAQIGLSFSFNRHHHHPPRFPSDFPPAFDNPLKHIKSPLTTTFSTKQPTMSAASKKSASSKPAAAKKAAAKATPSHPTWVDMIKVCLPFSRIAFCIHLLASTVLVSGSCDLNGQGKGRRGYSPPSADRSPVFCLWIFSAVLSTASIVLPI